MIEYVFWDSDNTLVETAEHHWRKHLETLKTLDIAFGEEHREKIYTNNGTQNWEWIKAELGLELDQKTYLDLIDRWYCDHIDEIAVRPGIMEAIQLFSDAGLPQAVVSNGRGKSVMMALEAKGLTAPMKFIFCKEDYEGRKPDPEPYLAALKKMNGITGRNVVPAACLVIEDDPKGVESGYNAGMRVFHRKMHDMQEDTPWAERTFFTGAELIAAIKDGCF